MSREERSAWVLLGTSIVGYVVYAAIVLSGVVGSPLVEAAYVIPMLAVIGGAIVAGIVVNILASIVAGIAAGIRHPDRAEEAAREAVEPRDERDRAIGRYAEYGGQAFLVAGALGALVLAFLEADHFWIANALFLAFTLSSVLGSLLRIRAYRWGMP